MGKGQGTLGTNFQGPLPVKSHRMDFIPTAVSRDDACELEKLIRNSVPRVFIRDWSVRHPLPSTHTEIPDSQEESRCSA